MITFYGRSTSDSVQKTIWFLEETGQPFEHIELGGKFGGLDGPDYRKLNPHGKVPTIVDGDVVVWESNSIIRYLGTKYCVGGLCPEDLVARTYADQWMEWVQTRVYPDFNGLFWMTVRAPKADQDAQRIRTINERLNGYYRLMDAELGKRSFLGGDSLTMADFPGGATLYRYFEMPIERPPLPNVERWYQVLRERPAYQKRVMVSFDELWGRLAF